MTYATTHYALPADASPRELQRAEIVARCAARPRTAQHAVQIALVGHEHTYQVSALIAPGPVIVRCHCGHAADLVVYETAYTGRAYSDEERRLVHS